METVLFAIARRFWPELETLNFQRKVLGAGEVVTFLYSTPLALAGIAWLVAASDYSTLLREWPLLSFLAGLMFLFRKLGYFFITEIRSGRYASSDGSMETMVLWIGLLLFGPVALWLAFLWSVIDFLWNWPRLRSSHDRWNRLRNLSLSLASTILASLIAFSFYRRWGGEVPIHGLSLQTILPAFAAILVYFLAVCLIWLGFSLYAIWTQRVLTGAPSPRLVVRFMLLSLGFPSLAHPFAILAAGLYIQNDFPTFIFFVVGLLLVAALTRQLSWAAERDRQRSRQLENLEELGRRILTAPPDASSLPELLQDCLPSMFPSGRYMVWVPGQDLLVKSPQDWEIDIDPVWGWLKGQNRAFAFQAKEGLPWQGRDLPNQAPPSEALPSETPSAEPRPSGGPHDALVVAPILDVESSQPVGGVYLELHSLAQPWDTRSLESLFPAVLSLAAQVASALHGASIYAQALAYQKVTQELALAGKIQASFLPDVLPRLNGWQLAVTLLPARETSGDFFDLITLSETKLGLLIADVTDKGVGAALYMALSRTLIRTYAVEFDDDPQPDVVFFAANGRLLKDARAALFVTAFYGILDLETGNLTYANAGHNPPYLLRSKDGNEGAVVEALLPTGMPIGIEEESVWNQQAVQLNPGDVLVLYTDGIPDAQNSQGDFFHEELLLETVTGNLHRQANEIQDAILERVQEFVGDAPQFDDITLMILSRDELAIPSLPLVKEENAAQVEQEQPAPVPEISGEPHE